MSGRQLGVGALFIALVTLSTVGWRGAAQTIPAARPPIASGPAALYQAKCAVCHAPGAHPGYLALKQMGQPEPDLTKRRDLDAEYVRTVVRNGIGQMPAMTAGYVGERDLDAISRYLAPAK